MKQLVVGVLAHVDAGKTTLSEAMLYTSGMTVADFRRKAPEDCHTKVALKLDQNRFWDLIFQALMHL